MYPEAPSHVYQDNDATIQIELNRAHLEAIAVTSLGKCLRLGIRLKMGTSCLYISERILC